MTGWLAAAGIALVLLTSAYAGLTDTTADIGASIDITPVSGQELEENERPLATPTPTAMPEPTAVAPVTNRMDCNQIRGTDYLSPEERTWYLANCVNR